MTPQQLMQMHRDTCDKARVMIEAKNRDYSGGSKETFANFKATEMLGIPAEIGVLVRVLDKIKRIQAFVVNGTLAVKEETVNDAIEDIINYMIILKGIIEERKV